MKLHLSLLFVAMLISHGIWAQYTELRNHLWTRPINYEFLSPAGWQTFPFGTVIEDGGVLYGTTSKYGLGGSGIIFRMNPDGTGYTELLALNTGFSDGRYPLGSLVSDGTFLYGTTADSHGTLFRINKDGTGFTTLHYFAGADGANPNNTLLLEGTTLYGSTLGGGIENLGTIFRINTDGTGFTKLYDFTSAAGGAPVGDLSTDGTSLFGCTAKGGATNEGTIFRVEKDGSGYSSIHSFSNATGFRGGASITDGNMGKLIYDGTFFYGTNNMGDAFGVGNLFKIRPDGTGYSNFFLFDNANGRVPIGSLAFDGVRLYGTASIAGGPSKNEGIVFSINTNGSGYTILTSIAQPGTDKKASGNLFLSGTTLFGISSYGDYGSFNTDGAVYRVDTDGSNFTELHSFSGIADGWRSKERLTFDGTHFYVATTEGGRRNNGTIYRIQPDGSGYEKILPYFPGIPSPSGGLLLSSGQLFGLASGNGSAGTIYRVDTDGNNFTSLHDFSSIDGFQPWGSLIEVSGSLFGVTSYGGSVGYGVIFRINPDGSGFSVIHEFNAAALGRQAAGTLFFDGTFLYGLTQTGGIANLGVVYKIKPDGTGYTKLLDFTGSNGAMVAFGNENSSLISDGIFLYGMTPQGGASNLGTVFRIMPDGSGYIKLHEFTGGFLNKPDGAPILVGSTLYGMTRSQLFRIETDGSNFRYLMTGCSGSFLTGNPFHNGTSVFGPTELGLIRLDEIGVSGVTPMTGPIGTTVTLTGQNLLAGTLRFNGVPSATSGTPTSITTTVPAGATTGPITITAGCVVATTADFTVSACSVSPPTPTDGDHCGPGPVQLGASGATGSQEYRWYNASSGGSSLGIMASYTTPAQTATTTFYVSIFDVGTGCESLRAPAIANIRTVPPAPSTTGNNSCLPASVTLTAAGGTNGEYRWYTLAAGGSAIAGEVNDFYSTPLISTTTTYHVSLANAFCESTTRTPVTATISSLSAPAVTTTSCTASSAVLTGPNGFSSYLWSNGATTPSITVTTAGSYSLAVTDAFGCTSPPSTSVAFTASFCNQFPTLLATSANTTVSVPVTIPVVTLISDPDNNVDLTTLDIIIQPLSGAIAYFNSNQELVVDYSGVSFVGTDQLTIEVCDASGACVNQVITIEVAGQITIFNAVSPNGDGKNEILFLEFIDALPQTKENKVTLFDRWGSVVFETTNYNNTTNVFKGIGNDGSELPPGTYYYSIEFSSGAPKRTGFISLRK